MPYNAMAKGSAKIDLGSLCWAAQERGHARFDCKLWCLMGQRRSIPECGSERATSYAWRQTVCSHILLTIPEKKNDAANTQQMQFTGDGWAA